MRPTNTGTFLVARGNRQSLSLKGTPEDAGEVIPHPARVEGVGKVQLRAAVVEPAGGAQDLERNAARGWVAVELLVVGFAALDLVDSADGAADGPDVDGVRTFVVDFCVADGAGKRSQGSQGEGGDVGEMHFVCWICVWLAR